MKKKYFLEHRKSLLDFNTFGINANARFLAQPLCIDDIIQSIRFAKKNSLPVLILGAGSNILIKDENIEALVLYMGNFDDAYRLENRLKFTAGVSLPRAIDMSVQTALGGLETFAGIPGSIGGSIKMNAGSKYGCVEDVIDEIELMDINTEEIYVLKKEEIGFSYRTTTLKDTDIILSGTFILEPQKQNGLKEKLRKILIEKKRTQPLNEKSAGCIFKNPEGISAGELIEKAGLKGFTIGGAKVSEIHANFIVNYNNATSRDILDLIHFVHNKILEETGYDLDLEIKIWP